MKLTPVVEIVRAIPAVRSLVESVRGGGMSRAQVLESAKPCLLEALREDLESPVLVLCAGAEAARAMQEQLLHWCPENAVFIFPERDALPHERLPVDPSITVERMRALTVLAGWHGRQRRRDGSPPGAPLVVTSAAALTMRTLSPDVLRALTREISEGMVEGPDSLMADWAAAGYDMEPVVEVPGTASRRGGVVDIYPVTSSLPVRIEFAGNRIESIRHFDPGSQRSLDLVKSKVLVPPAREFLLPRGEELDGFRHVLLGLDLSACEAAVRSELEGEVARLVAGQRFEGADFYLAPFNRGMVLDYLPLGSVLVLDEFEEALKMGAELDSEAEELWEKQVERGRLPRNFPRPYVRASEWRARADGFGRSLRVSRWSSVSGEDLAMPFEPAPKYGGHLDVFAREVKQALGQRERLLIVSQQAQRLAEVLSERDVDATVAGSVTGPGAPGSLTLLQGPLLEGWMVHKSLTMLTDAEIFGMTKRTLPVKHRPVRRVGFLSVPSPGRYVVHVDHGVARFAGTVRRAFGESEGEFLVLEYAGGDKLYVPVGQIDRLAPYIGPGDSPPSLSRLGSQEWSRTKERIKASVAKTAEDLLGLYASRKVAPGLAYPPDMAWQRELEAAFPYVETPDQAKAVAEVKADMEAPHPMDRLICGDVGYGKTEVALRSAFKAVMHGKQVAMLVPTTILAQQHYATFKERLEAFPVTVEVLSRFRSEQDQREVTRGLAAGGIDICIGTHRLLQKDVVFKDLGLVIVDEEQRFGVLHKERLKQMRSEVDVLALSATPIPRTLYMSLVGIRDISTIETPPEDRLPVKTYVTEYDDGVMREAVLREMERNGQVFFVHNRVQTIGQAARRLQEAVPQARLSIGHGQMPEEELERVMVDFADGKTDVLVCTTIIESGLDLPRVNTLIVDNAERLGLTQLYQLRGRVGRGNQRAYAYFLYPKGKVLTPEAGKRLRTIFEAQELGVGFHIAMKDLEIRGAGNLLGVEQSGHIAAVGFELYCRLLAQAVEELSSRAGVAPVEAMPEPPGPSVDLPLAAYLPDTYVSPLGARLALYQRLTRVKAIDEVADLARELRDRFGDLPPEAENLLYIVKVRALAGRAGVEGVYQDGRDIVIGLARPGIEALPADERGAGINIGSRQVRLDKVVLKDAWTGVLVRILERLGAGATGLKAYAVR